MLQIAPGTLSRELVRTKAEIEFDKARKNFWAYRVAIHPEMIQGWWPKEIARHLQR